ncbi:flavin-containing monooxygenase [Rhodococcus sp. NPDC127530]|uniref:flavin-containing monooxygenase n=1 Tax=unclassified Rhodococcus (in: high G+C Gram-positive bacteria) TaxID=192944 RepID=UPI0036303505
MTLSETHHRAPMDLDHLVDALENANIPALSVVTYQLTGDRRWISDAFRPTRAKGMDENRSGGLSEAAQAEVRRGAYDAIVAWADGAEIAVPQLVGDELIEILSFMNGEEVPPEYEDMMSEMLGFAPDQAEADPVDTGALSVLVIGAGVSGMLASLRLSEAGIQHVVVEKNSEVGGGWWENTYPGAGVDTPSHLYSYSFFDRDWSTFFGKRDEVQTYLADFADHFDLRRHIQFDSEVESLTFDEKTSTWTARVRRRSGEVDEIVTNFVITAVGVLNRPKLPNIEGLDVFTGDIFHTARWPEGLDLTGKRVALVGAGASAMQVGPAIADQVGSLTVFQRSPQWIAPNADYFAPVGESLHWLHRNVPFYARWYRAKLSWIVNDRVHPTLKVDPEWPKDGASINVVNDAHRRFFERYMAEELGDRQDLIEKSTPNYPPFGKRMLLDNGWFRMLRRDNVELVTEGVVSLDATGLTDSAGTRREFDVVILATGFESTRYLFPMEITGRNGMSLTEMWKDTDARAYLGMTVPGMPNLFLAFGPNTGLGHGGSIIPIAEWYVRYIMQALTHAAATGATTVECRPEVYTSYGKAVDRAHDELVWTDTRMTNWYRNESGRVVAVMPWRIVDYYAMTRHLNVEDYTWR